jgi:hypothetical protein
MDSISGALIMAYTTYKKYKLRDGTVNENAILVPATSEHPVIYIPKDETNNDYQEYLVWAKTNTIEEAD